MSKRDVAPEKIVRMAAIKAKAKKVTEQRNRNGALINLMSAPDGLYTHLMHCTKPGCTKTRKIKACDVFQVKFCTDCRDEQKKAGLKAFVARAKDPVVNAQKIVVDRIKRLDEWVARMNTEMRDAFARRDEFYKQLALEPKHHRVWP